MMMNKRSTIGNRFFSMNNTNSSTKVAAPSSPTLLKLRTSVSYLPKYPNANRLGMEDCGEDAYFVYDLQEDVNQKKNWLTGDASDASNSEANHSGGGGGVQRVLAIGVADGVGGYSEMIVNGKPVDPSEMAWALMEQSKKQFEASPNITPKQALTNAYDLIIRDRLVAVGGATACVVAIDRNETLTPPSYELSSINLGDSAFYVIREGKVFYRTQDQTHFFNCPYQLTAPRRRGESADDVSMGDELPEPLKLHRGDVIVLATDGLTDNVFDEDVASTVTEHMKRKDIDQLQGDEEQALASLIAGDLLKKAVVTSRSRTVETPFQRYSLAHRKRFYGGKQDDITICVCTVH